MRKKTVKGRVHQRMQLHCHITADSLAAGRKCPADKIQNKRMLHHYLHFFLRPEFHQCEEICDFCEVPIIQRLCDDSYTILKQIHIKAFLILEIIE